MSPQKVGGYPGGWNTMSPDTWLRHGETFWYVKFKTCAGWISLKVGHHQVDCGLWSFVLQRHCCYIVSNGFSEPIHLFSGGCFDLLVFSSNFPCIPWGTQQWLARNSHFLQLANGSGAEKKEFTLEIQEKIWICRDLILRWVGDMLALEVQ